ncbi:25543_t:CDS:1, partial [Gigaspora rosea]
VCFLQSSSFFGKVFCECSVWCRFIILGVSFVSLLQSCSHSLVSLIVVVMFSPVA